MVKTRDNANVARTEAFGRRILPRRLRATKLKGGLLDQGLAHVIAEDGLRRTEYFVPSCLILLISRYLPYPHVFMTSNHIGSVGVIQFPKISCHHLRVTRQLIKQTLSTFEDAEPIITCLKTFVKDNCDAYRPPNSLIF